MQAGDEALIRVHAEWDGWQSAEVRMRDLQDVHWLQPNDAPRRFVHAFISCSAIVSGDIGHRCETASAPHRLLVCVLKRHATAGAYDELVRRAGGSLVGIGH
jgi:hypothetical protein